MSALSELQNLSHISWPTLLIGLKKGWINKDAISDYANLLLTTEPDRAAPNVALLIATDSLNQDDIATLINEICTTQGIDLRAEEPASIEKWRLAHLSDIQNSPLLDEDKLTKLQELYAEFDYPEDMSACSIYHPGEISPLAAMHQLIEQLKLKLTKNKQAETPT